MPDTIKLTRNIAQHIIDNWHDRQDKCMSGICPLDLLQFTYCKYCPFDGIRIPLNDSAPFRLKETA